jgi:hypothetical protein
MTSSLPEEGFFSIDPEDAVALRHVWEDVCTALQLEGDATAQYLVLVRICELVNSGEKDWSKLRERLLSGARRGTD